MREIRRVVWFAILTLMCVAARSDADARLEVFLDSPELQRTRDVLLYRGEPFTGTVVGVLAGRVFRRTAFSLGREHGLSEAFYPNGQLKFAKHYVEGRREGTHRGYWPNGDLQFVYHYAHDLFDGEQIAYFTGGALAEVRHYEQGREEGQQSFWNPEGRLVANYTFKKGRRYGIVGRFDCISVASP